MTTVAEPRVIPIPVRASDPGPGEYFTSLQWQVLESIVDAAIPSIVVAGSELCSDTDKRLVISEQQCTEAYDELVQILQFPPTYDQFKAFLAARPLENPQFHKHIRRVLDGTTNSAHKKLGGVLNFMARHTGSLVATGYWTPLHQQPLYVREAIIQSWNKAWTPAWPFLAKTFCTMAKVGWAPTDPLLHKLSDYSHHSDDYKPGLEVDYKFMQFSAGVESITIRTDVIIVGSGCGGGVAAKVLAEAGHKVLVVDKGYYFPPSHLPMAADAGQQFLYEGGGAVQAANGATTMLAGSCWGGGGTVNWSACLELQDFVRNEWADEGLEFFREQDFQDSIDRVSKTMGVSDAHVRQNHGNKVLLEGAKKLGWHAKACPQNTGGKEHYCGRCSMGCGSGEKQGPAVNWLPAAQTAGAQFIEGFRVTEILFDDNSAGNNKRAIGVVGEWTARDKDGLVHAPPQTRVQRVVRVEAKRVIVASGSLNSPLLLMRSGLKNPQIGKNLHVHPCGMLTAAFPEDVKGWEGGILTSVVSTFDNLDGKGHGVKLEASSMLPHMVLFNLPWENALQWKTDALKYRQMNTYIAIVRDRDTGSVHPARSDGHPIVNYSISDFDRAHSLKGVVALAKLCYVQGATDIWPAIPGVPPFRRRTHRFLPTKTQNSHDSLGDPDFQAWLKILEAADNRPPMTQHTSAHQMGTCRMSADPSRGVVDGSGCVWGTENLYVADGSVFPSASGVNPMVTLMAISDRIARGVAAGM